MKIEPLAIEEFSKENEKKLRLIFEQFQHKMSEFEAFKSTEHDILGRVLKYHLIVEHYLTKYLIEKSPKLEISNARLSFYQKLTLISKDDKRFEFVRSGIERLNKIRNNFSHNLEGSLTYDEVKPILQTLKLIYPDKEYEEPIEVIEEFTAVVAVALATVDPDVVKAINKVISKFAQITSNAT